MTHGSTLELDTGYPLTLGSALVRPLHIVLRIPPPSLPQLANRTSVFIISYFLGLKNLEVLRAEEKC